MRQISAGMQRKPPSSTIERSREKNRFTEHGKQSTHKFREREITHRRSKSPAKRSKSPLKLSNKSQDRRSHITALARKEPKPVKVGRLPAPTNRRMMDESRDASDVSSDKRNFSRENGKAKSARKEPKPMQEAIECLAVVKDGKMATRILTKRKKPHAPNLSEVRVQVSARQAHKNSIIPRITIFQRKAKTEPKKEIKKQVSTMSKRESSTSKKKIKKHHQKSNILMNSLSIIAEEPSVEHDLPETLAPPTSDQKEENGGFSLTRPFTFRERKTEFKDPDTKKINVLSEDVGGTT